VCNLSTLFYQWNTWIKIKKYLCFVGESHHIFKKVVALFTFWCQRFPQVSTNQINSVVSVGFRSGLAHHIHGAVTHRIVNIFRLWIIGVILDKKPIILLHRYTSMNLASTHKRLSNPIIGRIICIAYILSPTDPQKIIVTFIDLHFLFWVVLIQREVVPSHVSVIILLWIWKRGTFGDFVERVGALGRVWAFWGQPLGRFLNEGMLGSAGAQVQLVRSRDELIQLQTDFQLLKLLVVSWSSVLTTVHVWRGFLLVRKTAHCYWVKG